MSGSSIIRFFSRVIVGLYFIEVGVLLTIAPWMGWLQQNYFADRLAWLRAAMDMPAWRALVVITGLITVLVGMADVWQAVGQRLARGRQPDA